MTGTRARRLPLAALLLVAGCASPPTWDDILGERAIRPEPAPSAPTFADSCAAGPFVMHFETNRDDLKPASRAVLDSMITIYRRPECRPARFIVTGHADRSGPHDLNVALSQRRLDRVRAYLLSNGVPETFLVSQAMGEDCPRTETADGVSEDSNRRVEVRMIVFSTPRAIARALECDTRWTH